MDNIYVNKNNKILQLLTSLASLIKLHAEDTKGQVEQNVDVIKILMEKYPDLQEKILEKEKLKLIWMKSSVIQTKSWPILHLKKMPL